MKRFIQYKKVMGLAMAALAFTACSDQWDDHYSDAPLPGANSGTLWQAIEKNEQLSNFKRVAEACGYDQVLKSTQSFTVFAPSNSHFTEKQADSVIALYQTDLNAGARRADNKAVKEFLNNHIARYNHSVTTTSLDTLTMLNGKYMSLSAGLFGGKNVLSSNELYGNGVLFTIDEPVHFYNNIFESIEKVSGLDSVKAFFYSKRYYTYEIDEANSVLGGIDSLGRNYFSDSVMVKYNSLFFEKAYLGRLNSEDSTYWVILPDNNEWDRMVTEFTPYFMYHKKISEPYDSMRWVKPRLAILEGTTFSQNTNLGLRDYAEGNTNANIDSLMSTYAVPAEYRRFYWGNDSLHFYQYGDKENPLNPFAAGGIFDGVEKFQCSNGQLLKSSQWPIDRKQTFLRDIVVEAENAHIQYNEKTTSSKMVTYTWLEGTEMYNRLSNHSCLEIKPRDEKDKVEIAIGIPDVLSNVPYDIYMVAVPECVFDSTLVNGIKFNAFRLYKDLEGEGPTLEGIDSLTTDPIENDPAYKLGSYSGKEKGQGYGLDIDTICLGKNIIFPSCSYGLDDPEVRIRIKGNVSSRDKNVTRTMRIDCIIFRQRIDPTTE